MRFCQQDFTYPLFLLTIDYFINDFNQWTPKKQQAPVFRVNLPKLPSSGRLYSLSKIGKKLYFTDINLRDLPKKEVTTDNFLQILLQIWQENAYLSHGEPKCYSPFKSIVDRWLKEGPLESLMEKRIGQLIELLPVFYAAVLRIVAEYAVEETEVSSALGISITLFKQAKQAGSQALGGSTNFCKI